MNECRDYEVEISALLDGESDPSTAFELLEHVGTCGSCGTFVRDIKAAQATIDRVYSVAEPLPTSAPPRRERRIGPMPRWAWSMAATIVVAVGGYVIAGAGLSSNAVDEREDSGIVVRLGENRGAMNDDRFMELTTELLGADRLYRDQMYLVLDAVRAGELPAEGGGADEINRSGEAGSDGRARILSTDALD